MKLNILNIVKFLQLSKIIRSYIYLFFYITIKLTEIEYIYISIYFYYKKKDKTFGVSYKTFLNNSVTKHIVVKILVTIKTVFAQKKLFTNYCFHND